MFVSAITLIQGQLKGECFNDTTSGGSRFGRPAGDAQCQEDVNTIPNLRCTLYDAVREYETQGCATNSSCVISEKWGWPMNNWCFDNVTSFQGLFYSMENFTEDISDWDVSGIVFMQSMFLAADSFNSDISQWNTSSAQDMSGMFAGAGTSFNIDLADWDISSVTNFFNIFNGATSFNQNLCKWGDAPNFPYGTVATAGFFDSL